MELQLPAKTAQQGMRAQLRLSAATHRAPASPAVLGHALVAIGAHGVVLLALLGVPQRVVRLGHLLELLGRAVIPLQCIEQRIKNVYTCAVSATAIWSWHQHSVPLTPPKH